MWLDMSISPSSGYVLIESFLCGDNYPDVQACRAADQLWADGVTPFDWAPPSITAGRQPTATGEDCFRVDSSSFLYMNNCNDSVRSATETVCMLRC